MQETNQLHSSNIARNQLVARNVCYIDASILIMDDHTQEDNARNKLVAFINNCKKPVSCKKPVLWDKLIRAHIHL
jgi:hypothetical protein